MATDVPLRCECGKIRGVAEAVEASEGTRCVCYCGDCQAFARFVGREGVLDAWGGTDIWQMSPGKMRLEVEGDALRCVKLTAEGMHRWYCGECRTPIANTLTAIIPFVGVVHSFMDHASGGIARDELLGPAHPVQTATAYGEGAPVQKSSAIFKVLLRTMGMVVGRKILGRGRVSPFFDAKTKEPKVKPQILSLDERRALAGRANATVTSSPSS
jgi:hypothetical protein